MHQQIPPLDQCGIPSQMAQPIVICPKLSYGPPIQLVYDAQTHTPIMVQRNEEQIQISQPMLLNVQNTPPWIQTPTQNVIYVQQTPNQMLPFIQPNMIQNTIFQTPYNFQQIIPQEPIRPIMQIPTLIQNSRVPNQPANLNYPILHEGMTQNPMINVSVNGAIEKMPFVAQNPVDARLKAEMMELNQLNNVSETETVPHEAQNQVNSNVRSEMKPITDQNQEKNISDTETFVVKVPSVPKKKMTVLSYLLNKNPSELEITPITKDRHVQTDFPHANTSKNTNQGQVSINNAEQNNDKTKGIPQLNSIDTRQDLIGSNLYNQRHTRPIRPNITRNSEVPLHIKSNISDTMNVRTIYRPILPKPVVKPNEFRGSNFVNPNFVTLRAPDPAQAMTLSNRGVQTNYTLINEAYNAPNVNNGIEIHNITSMSGGAIINNNERDINTQNHENMIENSATDKSAEKTAENKLNLISVEKIYLEEYEGDKYKQKENKEDNDNESELNLKPMIKNYIDEIQHHLKEKVGQKEENVEQKKKKADQEKEKVGPGTKKKINLDKNTTCIINKNDEKKCIKHIPIFILTHVLDGHVIQESNVAFPIHKPLKEKVTYEPYENDAPDWKKDVEPLLPLKYLHIVDNEAGNVGDDGNDEELDIDVVEDENPFSNLMKSTIEEWNMGQLSSHLTKHNWKETATKLREQEIDGESLLLVTEQQLLQIGVSEKHAELIIEFVNQFE